MATEDIQIRISVLDEATPYLEKISKSISGLPKMKGLSQAFGGSSDILKGWKSDVKVFDKMFMGINENVSGFTNLGDAVKFAGISQKDFNKWQKLNFFTMDNGLGLTNELTGDTLSYGRSVQYATLQNRRFKMEWLSIMFAGMALSRAFDSIVRAQENLWGWSQMTASMWTTVMAPAMSALSPIIFDIEQKIMDLPEDTQLTIGLTVLGLDWLGKLVTGIGEIYLAVNGLKVLFPGLATAIGAAGGGLAGMFKVVWGFISGIGVAVGVVVAVVIALIVSIVTAFNENFMGMKKIVTDLWSYIKQMFEGVYQIFKGVFDLIKALLKGDGEAVMKAVGNIIVGVLNLIIGAIGLAVNAMNMIMVGSIRLLVGIIQGVINGLLETASLVDKLLGGKGFKWRIDLVGLVGKLDVSQIKLPKIPSFQEGGYMNHTGLAYLHKGETVVPKGNSGMVFSPTINVNANISNDYDVRQLADKLNQYWAQSFQRTMRSRGSI